MQHITEKAVAYYKLAKWMNRNCSFIKREYSLQKQTNKQIHPRKQEWSGEGRAEKRKEEKENPSALYLTLATMKILIILPRFCRKSKSPSLPGEHNTNGHGQEVAFWDA